MAKCKRIFSAHMGFQLPLPPARFENCCQGLFANTLSILQFALFIIHFAFKLSVFLFGPIKFWRANHARSLVAMHQYKCFTTGKQGFYKFSPQNQKVIPADLPCFPQFFSQASAISFPAALAWKELDQASVSFSKAMPVTLVELCLSSRWLIWEASVLSAHNIYMLCIYVYIDDMYITIAMCMYVNIYISISLIFSEWNGHKFVSDSLFWAKWISIRCFNPHLDWWNPFL